MFLLSSGFLLFPPFCVVYATVICVNIKSILFFFSFFFFLIWKFCYLPTRPDIDFQEDTEKKTRNQSTPFFDKFDAVARPPLLPFSFLLLFFFF